MVLAGEEYLNRGITSPTHETGNVEPAAFLVETVGDNERRECASGNLYE
jgi:hypothetical protein